MTQPESTSRGAGDQRIPATALLRDRVRLRHVIDATCICGRPDLMASAPCTACVIWNCMTVLWARDDAEATT